MLTLIVFLFVLTGCAAQGNGNSPAESSQDILKGGTMTTGMSSAESTEGDFIYRLVTEKEAYHEGESVKLYAELEYIGDKKEVTIYHAASPFSFPITEHTRNYSIAYMMNQPLLTTLLAKGEPLREEYAKGGGYGSQDNEEYIAFIKNFWENGFPAGSYTVYGSADFYVQPNKEGKDKREYKLKAQVNFDVK
ncbi:hypothetical protein AB6A23_12400 [Paenibacillus tarimensis]